MINFLDETKEAIAASGHRIKDIVFIGSRDSGYSCSWDTFKSIANKNYDNGYGGLDVAFDLEIVFSDGSWLERANTDSHEFWQVIDFTKIPTDTIPIKAVFTSNPFVTSLTGINESGRSNIKIPKS